MSSIGTVISYCTNDFRYIAKCIEEASLFSQQIVVPVCDHFFDGTQENRDLLNRTYAENPKCQFIEFSYLPDRLYSPYHSMKSDDLDWSIYWAATARYVGLYYLDPGIDYVLFLDSDEILEGKEFLAWFKSGDVLDAQRLAAYYYTMSPTLRAKNVVNLPLFVKKSTLAPLTLLNGLERIGAYLTHPGPKKEKVTGLNGLPFVHHYSWVRTKEECLLKAKTWGHRHDENWPRIIEDAFSGKMDGLFGTNHEFENISHPYFDPFKDPEPRSEALPNVIKINERDLFRKEIEHALL